MNDTYIIITPCKNEANSLHDLFKSVIDQTIKPSLWVIVNDGSQDDSRSIILKYCDKYSWIKMVDLPERPRDSFYRYSEVCKVGFDYVVKFAKKENIDFQFIGLIDADLIIEKLLFEKLIIRLKEIANLGLVSGGIYYKIKNKMILEKNKEIFGAPRLWKKQCFLDTGGYQVTTTPDVVSNIKCIVNGWDILQVKDAQAIQIRKTFSAEGLLKGWYRNGVSQYIVGFHPIFAFLKSIKRCFIKPYYTGIAYFFGYFSQLFLLKDRTNDQEVYYYNYVTRRQNEIEYLKKKLNKAITYFTIN